MTEFNHLIKCPRCGTINVLYAPYFKCYNNCFYADEKNISYRINEFEEKQRVKVKEIIKFLFISFSSQLPLVEFPESSLNPDSLMVDWGWADSKINTIFIPRKTFYLPNYELADTTVHESCHLLSKEKGHSSYWYSLYLQQREKVFSVFSEFVNCPNPQAKFEKGYKIYPNNKKIKED